MNRRGKEREKEKSKELCEVFFSSAAVEEARELVAAADFIKLQVDELPRDMRNHKQLKEILKDTSRKFHCGLSNGFNGDISQTQTVCTQTWSILTVSLYSYLNYSHKKDLKNNG